MMWHLLRLKHDLVCLERVGLTKQRIKWFIECKVQVAELGDYEAGDEGDPLAGVVCEVGLNQQISILEHGCYAL